MKLYDITGIGPDFRHTVWVRCFIHRLISPMHQTGTRTLMQV